MVFLASFAIFFCLTVLFLSVFIFLATLFHFTIDYLALSSPERAEHYPKGPLYAALELFFF